jgi:hypothetical protein
MCIYCCTPSYRKQAKIEKEIAENKIKDKKINKNLKKEWKKILIDLISKLRISDLEHYDVKENKYEIFIFKEFEDCKVEISLDALLTGYCDSELIYKVRNSVQSVAYHCNKDIFEGTNPQRNTDFLKLRKILFRKGLCLSPEGHEYHFTKMNEEEIKYILDLYRRFSENRFLISEYELNKIESSEIEKWHKLVKDIV